MCACVDVWMKSIPCESRVLRSIDGVKKGVVELGLGGKACAGPSPSEKLRIDNTDTRHPPDSETLSASSNILRLRIIIWAGPW